MHVCSTIIYGFKFLFITLPSALINYVVCIYWLQNFMNLVNKEDLVHFGHIAISFYCFLPQIGRKVVDIYFLEVFCEWISTTLCI